MPLSRLMRLFLFAATLGFAALPANAQTDALTPQAQFIQNLGDQAISILSDKGLTTATRDAKFKAMLHDSFDLRTIGRFVIGRAWAGATPEQQKTYMDLFEALVVKTYSDRFSLYTNEGFKVRSSSPESAKDTLVASEILHPTGGKPTQVSWRVRTKDGKNGVLDVIVEGISMSVTQRQEYAAVLQRNGGDFEGLLTVMRQKLGSSEKVNW